MYYGSTTENRLTNRLAGHRRIYKRWINGKAGYTSSYAILKTEDSKIILLENIPCNTKYELAAREQWYIDNYNCVNKYKAPTGLTKAEYNTQHYIKNKDKIEEYKRIWASKNKNKQSEYDKRYYEHHKEEKKEYEKLYREKNKKIFTEKTSCLCGGHYTKHHEADHYKAKKHQKWIVDANNIQTSN